MKKLLCIAWASFCNEQSNIFSGLIAEVTQPSLGVGYEIGRAVAMGKNILCLYRPQQGKSKHT